MDTIALYIFFAFSVLTFTLFLVDRHRRHYGLSGITDPLLFIFSIPGAFGSLCAMILFSHKTTDRNYLIWIPVLACVDTAIITLIHIFS